MHAAVETAHPPSALQPSISVGLAAGILVSGTVEFDLPPSVAGAA